MPADTSALFSPIRIGTMELRNRLVMSPMENSFGTPTASRPNVRSTTSKHGPKAVLH